MTTFYPILPIPKPRQTQRDRWQQRPCVMRYRAFKDKCRLLGVTVPEFGAKITFLMPMPKSWSKKKKNEYVGTPHRQKPDIDNLLKSLLDAVYEDDSCVWQITIRKVWTDDNPGISITELEGE